MLYLLDIPAGRNMANPQGGKLLKSLVAPEALARRPIADAIESHDIGFRPPSQPISVSEGDTKGIQEWMKQNGYLAGGQAVDVQLNVPKDEEKGEKR